MYVSDVPHHIVMLSRERDTHTDNRWAEQKFCRTLVINFVHVYAEQKFQFVIFKTGMV
jgi:hypothetical protein